MPEQTRKTSQSIVDHLCFSKRSLVICDLHSLLACQTPIFCGIREKLNRLAVIGDVICFSREIYYLTQ
jgi:hypothetical protein